MIHNPELASRVQALGEHLRYGTGLSPQLVEIAVLITARRWSCDYEWAAHARIAQEAGLAAEIIDALAVGAKPEQLDAEESVIYDFAWETVWHGTPGDDAFDSLAGQFGLASALDVLAVCGYYTMLAFVLNAAGLPLPEGARPLEPLANR